MSFDVRSTSDQRPWFGRLANVHDSPNVIRRSAALLCVMAQELAGISFAYTEVTL
jgi:hypothetical protein